ncbi:uncharacterized [Tachysurus ichikawai]
MMRFFYSHGAEAELALHSARLHHLTLKYADTKYELTDTELALRPAPTHQTSGANSVFLNSYRMLDCSIRPIMTIRMTITEKPSLCPEELPRVSRSSALCSNTLMHHQIYADSERKHQHETVFISNLMIYDVMLNQSRSSGGKDKQHLMSSFVRTL